MPKKIILVIPCYNEEKRLKFSEFDKYNDVLFFLFVNDGSSDGTLNLLHNNLKENSYILNLQKNTGKAEAVRQGFLFAEKLPIFSDVEWIGYWDADLQIPLFEINNFLIYAKNFYDNKPQAIFGSRVCRLGSTIQVKAIRRYFGRIFAVLTNILFHIDSYDSQCGAKVFNKNLINKYFKEPFISKWLFDLEIILRMGSRGIIEYPLIECREMPDSKINLLSMGICVLIDLLRLKKKYGRLRYQGL